MLAMVLINRMNIRRRLSSQQRSLKSVKTKNNECCRTCLSKEYLVSIFYNKETEKRRTEDLRLVTGLEIKMNDGLSQKICEQCIETMNTALQFRRKSKKAEETLLNMLSGPKTKKRKPNSKLVKPEKLRKLSDTETKKELMIEDFSYDQYDDPYMEDYPQDYGFEVEEPKPKGKQKPGPKQKRVKITLGPGGYKCTTCHKEFRMKATYKAHMRFHTNYCVCESCGKRCRNNNQLQEHKRARHGLGRIHKCVYCEYSSATKEALTIHERRHTGERPYICDHCGASFHRRSNLVQHIAIHLPEKNFQCPTCPKRLQSKKLLLIHEYKYHKPNPYRYICPVCSDTFTRPANVRKHLEKTHRMLRERQGIILRIKVNTGEGRGVKLGDV